MLKMKGNKEFLAWWEHWMSRIHPHRTFDQPARAEVIRKGSRWKSETDDAGSSDPNHQAAGFNRECKRSI
jgi:hypothetical protein